MFSESEICGVLSLYFYLCRAVALKILYNMDQASWYAYLVLNPPHSFTLYSVECLGVVMMNELAVDSNFYVLVKISSGIWGFR